MQFRVFWSQVTRPSPALSMGFSLGQGFAKAQLPACSSCELDQSGGVGLTVGSDRGGVRSRCPTRKSAFAVQLMVIPASSRMVIHRQKHGQSHQPALDGLVLNCGP